MPRSGKSNIGHALETAVLHALQRRGAQVNYVRTAGGYEVDFLVRDVSGKETLIQVGAELGNPATLAREVRALQDAAETWPGAALQLITLHAPTVGELLAGIELCLVGDWLLELHRTCNTMIK